jgi:hypothetical protein
MSVAVAIIIGIIAFSLGLFFGHKLSARRHHEELARVERGYQRVIDFADEYIEANAPHRAFHVIRNADGHIVQLLMRCGTSALLAKDMLQEQRRRKALH